MSLIKANAVQVGQSNTATQNFTLAVPSSPDGTIKLARGNSGATTQDVMNVSNAGVVSFPQGLGNISNSTAIATGSTTARSLANRFADVVNVKDFGAVGDGVAPDASAIQDAIDSMSSGSVLYFPDGEYLVNTICTITTDDITIDFGGAIIINTNPLASFVWQGQTVNPLFFFNANNGRVLNGHFIDCVSQGVLAGGITSNNKTGFYISGTRFTNLVVANIGEESKCVQTRHVNNVIYDGIVCKNIGITKTLQYSPTLSINYANNAVITNCIVDGDSEGGGVNFLYVENGSISNNQLINISNVSATQEVLGIHVKYSNHITITGNNVRVSGGAIKVSEDTNYVTITSNYFESEINSLFAGIYLQGPTKLTLTGNVIVANTSRAIYISPHLTTDPMQIVISDNYIRGNYKTSDGSNTVPSTYGSGLQINAGLAVIVLFLKKLFCPDINAPLVI